MFYAFLFVMVNEGVALDSFSNVDDDDDEDDDDSTDAPSVKSASDYTVFAAFIAEYGSELRLRRTSEINELTARSSNMY